MGKLWNSIALGVAFCWGKDDLPVRLAAMQSAPHGANVNNYPSCYLSELLRELFMVNDQLYGL